MAQSGVLAVLRFVDFDEEMDRNSMSTQIRT